MILPLNCEHVPEALMESIQGFSGAFSHFFLWRPRGILFDCGEGCGVRMDDHVFRVEVLALSHGHSDHCRGLLGFLEARRLLKGSTAPSFWQRAATTFRSIDDFRRRIGG